LIIRIFEVIKTNSPKHIKLKEFKNFTTSICEFSEIRYICITADIILAFRQNFIDVVH